MEDEDGSPFEMSLSLDEELNPEAVSSYHREKFSTSTETLSFEIF